jgi:hypothetical protein
MSEQPKITALVEYRDVVGFTGYRVGDDGSVWSRKQKGGNDRKPGRMGEKWKLLSQCQNTNGYSCVNLFRDGKNYIIPVCYLVLEAFVGPRPPKYEACHFPDRDTTNNRLDNLRWDTRSGNQQDRKVHGTVNECKGEKNPFAILTEPDVRKIIQQRFLGESYKSIALEFNTTSANICRICTGKSWRHLNIELPGKGKYANRKS